MDRLPELIALVESWRAGNLVATTDSVEHESDQESARAA